MLWHQRMGHIGEKGLTDMQKNGIVKGFLDFNLEVNFCEHFIYGKKIWLDSYMEQQGKRGFWN
jgi:hypothetical protein